MLLMSTLIIAIVLIGFCCCCCLSIFGGGGLAYFMGDSTVTPPDDDGTSNGKTGNGGGNGGGDDTPSGPMEGDIGASCKTGDVCNSGGECKYGVCFEKCQDKGDCKADLVPRKDDFYCDYSDCKEAPKEAPEPFKVGDKVLHNWRLPATATDLCAPSPDDVSAYGTVKKVADKKVHVKWDLIKNPTPKTGMKPYQCCWKRKADNSDGWNMKYWGDETKDPTYKSGLKSIFSFDDAKTKLKADSSSPSCPAPPPPPPDNFLTRVQLCCPWQAQNCPRAGKELTCAEFHACRAKTKQCPCGGDPWFKKCGWA